jgi:peptide deformylase
MIDTMRAAPGVGLAGPQVGVPLRLAVIEVDEKITVIVNPVIVKSSGEVELDEGCLSVPGFWGRLNRAERVSVKALDRHGKELRIRDAEGLFAQALQHEIDHLDGFLYVDRMETLEKLQRSEPMRKREADARQARRDAGLADEDDADDDDAADEEPA